MASVADSSLRRIALALAAAVAFVALPACTHPCLALAEQMCECFEQDTDVTRCKQNQKDLYDRVTQGELDASREQCLAAIDTCECGDLTSEEGKQACGLARE